MKKYNLITPEGTRDLLFDECTARREIENRFMNLFKNKGYSEVVTPFLEFYDLFDTTERHFPQESMYKLTDAKGRLMVLRPDSTLPILRLAQTRLRDEPRPLKLCYNQSIYRSNPKDAGRDDEIAQIGIEIIGGDSVYEHEALSLALEALELTGLGYSFEIGNCAIFNSLVEGEGISIDKAEELRQLIENKNYPELSRTAPASIAKLPSLFGGVEVFINAIACEPLEELKKTYAKINNEKVTVDLGLTNTHGYYTGLLFNGYAEGFGKPILSGGRYKLANTEGIGFALNVSAIAGLKEHGNAK